MDACFQCKFYQETCSVDFKVPKEGLSEELRLRFVSKGFESWAKTWIEGDKNRDSFDQIFSNIADFIADNNIFQNENQP